MEEKVLERAFNRALSQKQLEDEKLQAKIPLTKEQLEAKKERKMRTESSKMTTKDAVERMLLADKDKDYIRLLELPQPGVDALDRTTWKYDDSDISRAYRKLSALVHPDKNQDADARQAFEALNRAHKVLLDKGKRDEVLTKHLEMAKLRRDAVESMTNQTEKGNLYLQRQKEAEELRKKEADAYSSSVSIHQRKLLRAIEQKRQREKLAKRRQEECGSDSDASDKNTDVNPIQGSGDSSPEINVRVVRKKKKFLF